MLSALYFFTIGLMIISCQNPKKADILITNGTIYNGVDTVPKNVDIAIKGDKILFIGDAKKANVSANSVLDATGLIVLPGFIDPHTHATGDLGNKDKSGNIPFLMQGVTTVTIGNDGNSPYPYAEQKENYKSNGLGTNIVLFTGHGTIRKEVMGSSDRKATYDEIAAMKQLVEQEMRSGAFGMSTGLFYAPGSYANTEEVIALAETVAAYGGIYDTHLRDEGSFSNGLIKAVEEAITIGTKAEIPVHISHIKCLGKDVWHQSDSIIELIENAQDDGLIITANQYPYEASATGLKSAVVPRWAESGGRDSLFFRLKSPSLKQKILTETELNIERRGGPDKLLVVGAKDNGLVGKNVLELSSTMKLSPAETVLEILKSGPIKVASFNMTAYDIENFMRQPWVVTGSDGGDGHPRKYGTFPRKYKTYVEEKKVIGLAQFITVSSSKTAEILKIPNRGQLNEGYYADIIVFNPDTFRDKATYTDAFALANGLVYSIVNGKIAVKDGAYTEVRAGKVLAK